MATQEDPTITITAAELTPTEVPATATQEPSPIPVKAVPSAVQAPPKGARCDVVGCGAVAAIKSSGTETDKLNRQAKANLYVCEHHQNWPHSKDAERWILDNENTYTSR